MIKKIVIRIVVLMGIFIGTLGLCNMINNSGINDQAIEMNKATLPVMYVEYNNRKINTLYGYTGDVNQSLFRETITPLAADRKLEFIVNEHNNNIQQIDYEVRSIDGSSLVEEGVIEDTSVDNGMLRLSLNIRMDLEQNTEYMLKITLNESGNITPSFYTRIVLSDEMHIAEKINFVYEFNEAIFDKTKAEGITKYLEPNLDVDNTSLAKVNIHANFDTITFAELAPMRVTEIIPEIKEIDKENASIQLHYVIAAGDEDNTKYYNVTEFYRIKYIDENTIYLMDYEREQEQIFENDDVDTDKNRFRFGISNEKNIPMHTSDEGEKVCFVNQGKLWYYDYNNTLITEVFSFKQNDFFDDRTNNNQYDIDVISFKDTGDIEFIVYGYIPRGRHEGELGISVYRFLSETSIVEELLFIQCDLPYEVLREDVSKLSYLNENNEFYYYLNGSIVKVNTVTKESEEVVYGISCDAIAAAENHSIVAYQENSKDQQNDKITIVNLKDNISTEINSNSGQKICTIGFIGQDLVYGIANNDDILNEEAGGQEFPMNQVVIVDEKNSLVKEYSKSGIYVMSALVDGNVINFTRATKSGNKYQDTSSDFITYKDDSDNSEIAWDTVYDYEIYNQLYLVFPSYIYVTAVPKLIITKELVTDDIRAVKANEESQQEEKYYVYGIGTMEKSYDNIMLAIEEAKRISGCVVNRKGEYIWRMDGYEDYFSVTDSINTIKSNGSDDTIAACLSMILSYEGKGVDYQLLVNSSLTPWEVINKYTGLTGTNLSGCEIDVLYYYLSNGAPVITKIASNQYVLVTSYNGSSVKYIDPISGEAVKEDIDEFKEKLDDNGYVCYSYIR